MTRIKKIFSRNIALKLKELGHDLAYTEVNREKEWLTVFCFVESDELLNDLTKLSNR